MTARLVAAFCGIAAIVLAVLVMVGAGADVDRALVDLRASRPAAGPQSHEQESQVARLGARLAR